MTKKYLVKLTPHDKFFFGGENTFGEGDTRNYFVKSNYFPQQTTLLGLVRYQLIVQNSNNIFKNNTIINKEKTTEYIGHKSFEISDVNYDFGKIKEISPVFIAGENEDYLFPANREYQWVEEEDGKKINDYQLRQYATEKGSSSIYKKNEFIPYLKGYNPKLDLPDLLINKGLSVKKYYDFDSDEKKKDDLHNGIFNMQQQIGIRKNYKGVTEENAFYVQTFYKMLKGYSFAFILELEEGVNFGTKELVTLGGEQSKFRMEVVETDIEFDKIIPDYEKSKNSDKIVLVSDAYVSNDIFKDCDFAITDTIDFRSIKSTLNTTKYSSLDRTGTKNDELSKSNKYNFFKKGSVFYGDDISKITKHFDNTKNGNGKSPLKKIGYNHYKIVNKEENKL